MGDSIWFTVLLADEWSGVFQRTGPGPTPDGWPHTNEPALLHLLPSSAVLCPLILVANACCHCHPSRVPQQRLPSPTVLAFLLISFSLLFITDYLAFFPLIPSFGSVLTPYTPGFSYLHYHIITCHKSLSPGTPPSLSPSLSQSLNGLQRPQRV